MLTAALDDTAIDSGLQRDQPWAVVAVVRLCWPSLLATARRLAREDRVSDIVRSALLHVVHSTSQFRSRADLERELRRVVIASAIQHRPTLEKTDGGAIESLLPAFTDDGRHVEPVSSGWSDVPGDTSRRHAIVRDCINRLPDRYRDVLILIDVEGLPVAEVADVLSMSRSSVKLHVHRARQAVITLMTRALSGSGEAGSK